MKKYRVKVRDVKALALLHDLIQVQLPDRFTVENTGEKLVVLVSAHEGYNLSQVLDRIQENGFIATYEEVQAESDNG